MYLPVLVFTILLCTTRLSLFFLVSFLMSEILDRSAKQSNFFKAVKQVIFLPGASKYWMMRCVCVMIAEVLKFLPLFLQFIFTNIFLASSFVVKSTLWISARTSTTAISPLNMYSSLEFPRAALSKAHSILSI